MTWPIVTSVAFVLLLVIGCWLSWQRGFRRGYQQGSSDGWRRWQKAAQAQDNASAWRRKGGRS